MSQEPVFLSIEEILYIHSDQIENYGGTHGVRDLNLLASAVSQPEQSFGGEFLHPDVFSMAAAYLFHLCQNHPFIDGNKRTALASSLVFLEINGEEIEDPGDSLYALTIKVANGELNKGQIAAALQKLTA